MNDIFPGRRTVARKAQIWSFEFMASVTIFFMILLVLFFVWEYTGVQTSDQMVFNDMQGKALNAVDTLIRVRGFPEYWDESNVEILGLASEENVLNESKIVMFVNMDYNKTRRLMGIYAYNFYFQIFNLNNTQAYSGSTALVSGIDPAMHPESRVVIPVERYVLFDHRVAKLTFILWR